MNLFRAWGPAAIWATVLFLLSAVPDTGSGGLQLPLNDKLAHAMLYAVLGATLANGRARSGSGVSHVLLIVLGVLYGASDEWHQGFVPGRDPDPADWLADVVGLLVGYGTTTRFLGRTNDHRNSVAEGHTPSIQAHE